MDTKTLAVVAVLSGVLWVQRKVWFPGTFMPLNEKSAKAAFNNEWVKHLKDTGQWKPEHALLLTPMQDMLQAKPIGGGQWQVMVPKRGHSPAFGIIAGPPQTVIKRLGTWQR